MSTFSGASALMIDAPKQAFRPMQKRPWVSTLPPIVKVIGVLAKPDARIAPQLVSIRRIIEETSRHLDLPVRDIMSRSHLHPLVDARAIVCYLACEFVKVSLPQISQKIGGRDHTTVIHHRDRVRAILAADATGIGLVERDKKLLAALNAIREKLTKDAPK